MAEHKQRVNILGIDPDAVWIDQINRINELREGSPLTNEERERALAHHIKNGGGSADVFHTTLKLRLGQESFLTKAEAIQAAQKGCDEHGIDPTLDPRERITRYIDIMHGSPHTAVEKDLMVKYQQSVSNESVLDEFTIHSGKKVDSDVLQLLIAESVKDKFLGDIATTKKIDNFKVFYAGKEPVGFAIPRKDSDGRYRTGAIFVLPQHRNKGYAGKFASSYFNGKKGRAYIEPDNTSSANLFTSVGFKKSGKQLKDADGSIFNEWLKG